MLHRAKNADCSSINAIYLTTVLAECTALGASAKLRKVTISFIMSVRLSIIPHGTTLFSLDGFSRSLIFGYFSKICFQKSFVKIRQECRYFIRNQFIFLIISRSVIFKMRNISGKSCREKRKTHFMFNNGFFFQNRAVGEITWKNMAEPDRPQMLIRRMCAHCLTGVTNTHRNM
jgi:hypothetical protein